MNTSTVPNLALASNAVTGTLPSAPTVVIGDLAWSNEETVVRPKVAPLPSRQGSALLLAAMTSVLLGAISVVAALGVLTFDNSDAPRTAAVRDGTHSAPASSPLRHDDDPSRDRTNGVLPNRG